MALIMSPPCGINYNEDEEIDVFESTAAELGGPARPRLPEISVISPGLDPRPATAALVRGQNLFCFVPRLVSLYTN